LNIDLNTNVSPNNNDAVGMNIQTPASGVSDGLTHFYKALTISGGTVNTSNGSTGVWYGLDVNNVNVSQASGINASVGLNIKGGGGPGKQWAIVADSNAGYVQLGYSDPNLGSQSYRLDVNGTGHFNGNLRLGTNNGVSSGGFTAYNTSGGATTNGLTFGNMNTGANSNVAITWVDWASNNIAQIRDVYPGGTQTGSIAFLTANSGALAEAMRIANTGNVGIGTTTPAEKLSVVSSTGIRGLIESTGTDGNYAELKLKGGNGTNNANWSIGTNIAAAGGATDSLYFYKNEGTIGTKMVINNAGNVGIGTTSPGYKLGVVGSLGITDIFTNTRGSSAWQQYGSGSDYYLSADNSGLFKFANNSGVGGITIGSSYNSATPPSGGAIIQGNVGIGTTTPASLLHLYGPISSHGQMQIQSNAAGLASTQLIEFNDSAQARQAYIYKEGTTGDFVLAWDDSSLGGDLRLVNCGATKVIVKSANGNVGIGTTTPLSKLAVSGGASIGANYNIAAPTNGLIVEGNVGIGNSNPGTALDVQGILSVNLFTSGFSYHNTFINGGNLTPTGSGNLGIGTYSSQVLGALTSGEYNTAVGGRYTFGAGHGITSGSRNSLFGNGAGASISTGTGNTGVGYLVTYLLTTGSYNTAVGDLSGRTLLSGSNNLFLGASTDVASAASTTLTNSSAIGYGAVVTASNQVVLGNTSVTQTLLNGNVGIGTTSPYSLLSISNSASTVVNTPLFTIASTTAGNSTTTLMTVLANGNVGIGTTNPQNILDVNLSSVFSGGALFGATGSLVGQTRIDNIGQARFFQNNGSGVTTNLFQSAGVSYITGGNVGIGTTNPTNKLEVSSTADEVVSMLIGPKTAGNNGGQILFNGANTNIGKVNVLYNATNNGVFTLGLHNGSSVVDRLTVLGNNGNVGIGTTSPSSLLSVHGTSYVSGTSFFGGAITATSTLTLSALGAPAGSLLSVNASGTLIATSTVAVGNLSLAKGNFLVGNDAGVAQATSTIFISSVGNVGIGTVSPSVAYKLDVAGNVNITANSAQLRILPGQYYFGGSTVGGQPNFVQIDATPGASKTINIPNNLVVTEGKLAVGTTSPWGQLSVNPNGITGPAFVVGSSTATNFIVTNGGNVGIGTTNPGSLLEVAGNASFGNTVTFGNQNGGNTTTFTSSGNRLTIGNANTDFVVGGTGQFVINRPGSGSGSIDIGGNLNNSNRLNVTGNSYFNGNVGIGTTSPVQKLELLGQNGLPAVTGTTQNGNFRIGSATNNVLDFGNTAGAPVWGSWIQSVDRSMLNVNYPLLLNPNGGNVGIGTTSPQSKLYISGTSGSTYLTIDGVNGQEAGFTLKEAGTAKWSFYNNGNDDSLYLYNYTRGGVDLTVNPTTGNVGIGTTSPQNNLHLYSTNPTAVEIDGTTAVRTIFAQSNVGKAEIGYGSSGYGFTHPTGTYLAYDNLYLGPYQGSAPHLTMLNGGNVGIGTTTPGQKLSVAGDILGNNFIGSYFTSTSTTATSTFAGGVVMGSNGFVYQQATGNVGIGGVPITNNRLTVYGGGLTTLIATQSSAGQLILTNFNAVGNYSELNFGIDSVAQGVYVRGSGNDNTLSLGTNSATRLTVASGGNVGIGTTTPNQKLSIFNSTGDSAIEFSSLTGDPYKWTIGQDYSDAGKFKISSSSALGTSDRFVIDGNGNVGIGTTDTAGYKLNVNGQIKSTGQQLYIDANTYFSYTQRDVGEIGILGNGAQYFMNYDTANARVLIGDGNSTFGSKFGVAGNASIGSSYSSTAAPSDGLIVQGNVGIGTTSPYSLLSISNSATTAANTPLFTIASTTAGNSTTTLMTVLANGNVGIGTASPSANLHVLTSVAANAILETSANQVSLLKFRTNGNDQGYVGYNTTNGGAFGLFDGSGNLALSVINGGNVGIGTTSPGQKLSVAGDILGNNFIGSYFTATSSTATSTFAGFIDVNGTGANATSTFASNLWVKGTLRTGTGSMYLNDVGLTSSDGNINLSRSATSTLGTNGLAIGTSQFVVQQTSGNVGIGIASPIYPLQVGGLSYLSGGIRTTSISDNGISNGITLDGSGIVTAAVNIQSRDGGNILRLVNSSSNAAVTVQNGGNVGIGTTSPWAKLSVAGSSLDSTTPLFSISSSTPTATTTVFHITSQGNVGIGAINPVSKLEIEDALPFLTINGSTNAGFRGINFSNGSTVTASTTNNSNTGELRIASGFTGWGGFQTFYTNGSERLRIDTSGFVGIGTTSPAQMLSVAGKVYTTGGIQFPDGSLQTAAAAAAAVGTQGQIGFYNANGSTISGTSTITITQAGFVGIGTTSPAADLHISGSANVNGYITTTSTNNIPALWLANNFSGTPNYGGMGLIGDNSLRFSTTGSFDNARMTISSAGNVGIGTTNPTYKLSVSAPALIGVAGGNASSPATTTTNIVLYENSSTNWAGIGADGNGGQFFVTGVSAPATRLYISNTGNVGIGTTSPQYKLSVDGAVVSYGSSITANNAAGTRGIVISDDGTSAIIEATTHGASYNNLLLNPTAGNVGIGTTTPGSDAVWAGPALDISGARGTAIIRTTGAGGIATLRMTGPGASSVDDWHINMSAGATSRISFDPKAGSISPAGLHLVNDGNVGIGTTNPGYKLEVAGTVNAQEIRVNGVVLNPGTGSNWTVSGADVYRNGGNVGIGTTSPMSILSVAAANPFITVSGSTFGTFRAFGTTNGTEVRFGAAGTVGVIETFSNHPLVFAINDTEKMRIDTSGNVGIGTTSPNFGVTGGGTKILDVQSASDRGIIVVSGSAGDTDGTAQADLSFGATTNTASYGTGSGRIAMIRAFTSGLTATNRGGMLQFYTKADNSVSLNTAMTINNTGNVGVGTTTPWGQLSVNPNGITGPSFVIGSSTKTDLIVTNAGLVGIGTMNPVTTLDIAASTGSLRVLSTNSATYSELSVSNNDQSATSYYRNYGTTAVGTVFSNPVANSAFFFTSNNALFGVGTYSNAPLVFGTNNIERIRVDTSGNVGIGTTTPWGQLSVNPNGITGPAFVIGSSTATKFMVTNSGVVVIGTTTTNFAGATARLVVTGDTFNSAQIRLIKNSDSYLGFLRFDTAAGAEKWGMGHTGTIPGFGTNNDFAFWEDGAAANTRLMIKAGGNVGIGTTSPFGILSVQNSSNTVPTLVLHNSGGSGTVLQIDSTTGSSGHTPLNIRNENGTSQLIVTNSGNVGIGTSTPQKMLSVKGDVLFGSAANGTGNPGAIDITTSTGSPFSGKLQYGTDGTGWKFAISKNQAGAVTDQLTIQDSGNVGIGTSTPGAKLEVFNATGESAISIDTTSGNSILGFKTGGVNKFRILNDYPSANKLSIYDYTYNGIVTTWSGGNIGIGTSSPMSKLAVEDLAATTIFTVSGGSNGYVNAGARFIATNGTDARGSGVFMHDVGSGTEWFSGRPYSVTDQFIIARKTSAATDGSTAQTGNALLTLSSAGALTVSSCTGCSSDQRLKQNVIPLSSGSVLDKIRNLRPVAFSWRPNAMDMNMDTSRVHYGFIAQEAQSAFPELVYMDSPTSLTPDGTYLFNYQDLISPLTIAVQELDSRTRWMESATTSTVLSVDVAGRIGIGTSTPSHTLEVIGDIAAIAFVNTSTKTSKKDITYASASSTSDMLDQLVALKVATYRYTLEDQSNPLRIGLIAEDTQAIAPEILSADGKGVDIYKLATFNLAATQALAARFDLVETRVASLESRLAALESGAVSTASGSPLALSTSSLASAIESIGNVLNIGKLVSNTFYAAKSFINNLTVANVTVGSTSTPSGVTLFDSVTKQPYCFSIANGAPTTTPGICAESMEDMNPFATTTPTITATTTSVISITEALTVTLLGDNPLRLPVGGTFVEPGITVTNNASYITFVNGIEQEATAATIDTTSPTTYIITYRAMDAAGNTATATRSVIVENVDSTISISPDTATSTIDTTATTTPITITDVTTDTATTTATTTP
jgi:hypothetical protein